MGPRQSRKHRMHVLKVLSYILSATLAAGALISVTALRESRQRIETLEAESRLMETRHGTLEYAVWGEGPPVLVIHGAGGGFDQGRLLAEALGGDGFTWISVSRFGYLRSELTDNRSPADQADAIADLLEGLGLPQVDVMAMSGGVPPALQLGELYPDQIGRMVLLSSAPFTPFSPDVEGRPIPSWVYEVLLGNDVVYWLLTHVFRGGLEQAFDARIDLREDLSSDEEAFIRQLVDGFMPASKRVAGVGNEGASVDPEMVYRLDSIEAPILVIHARDDRLNPFAVAEVIAERVPNARLIALDDGGHLLLGHHAEVRRLARNFLSGLAGVE